MTSKTAVLALATCICVFGLWHFSSTTAQNKSYQLNAAPTQDAGTVGRFQIAAFETDQVKSGAGYYIIDSATGEIWMGYGELKPRKVSGPLR